MRKHRSDRAPIVHAPGVLRVPLTRGMFCLIDEVDGPLVAENLWYASLADGSFYAARSAPRLMHRVLMECPPGLEVDHINGDTLDNRRSNLRLCTPTQNKYNMRVRRDSLSGFRGVQRHSKNDCWVARAKYDGKNRHLGCFATAEEAARAYDNFVVATRGAFAIVNFPSAGQRGAMR